MTSAVTALGKSLSARIQELETDLSAFLAVGADNVDSEWMIEDPLQDDEKEAMTQEIASLQSQQLQVASRYEKLRKSVSDMRNDSYRLKQKLKYNEQTRVMASAELGGGDIPRDPETLKKMIVNLRLENGSLTHQLRKRGVLVKSSTARARAQAAKDKALKEKGMAAMGNLKVGDDLVLEGSTIVGGSLEQLLAALLSRSCPDPKFANDFMLTYPYLISAADLLREVADAYDKNVHDNASQLKVFNILKYWIEHNIFDFKLDPKLLQQLQTLFADLEKTGMEKQASFLQKTLDKKLPEVELEIKTFLISKKAQLNVLKLDSQDAAKQLTFIDSALFRLIQPADILNRKNIAIARRYEKFSRWIKDALSKSKKPKLLVKKLWEIAALCHKLRNYHSLFTIVWSIKASGPENEKAIQKLVKKNKEIHEFVDPKNKFSNYQAVIAAKTRPAVPFFEMYTEALNEVKMTPETKEDLVNFDRYRMLARVVQEVQHFQSAKYNNIEPIPELCGLLQTLPAVAN
mmetsp:Transcript_5881/g.18006  ORF Transcript_5881/g.18006 Transcript_5881/m.18006 type:complete len:517 (+) Transcript_5881:142-1692(+)